MQFPALQAISPIDGRYRSITAPLSAFFSEASVIRYRIKVEIAWFLALCDKGIPQLQSFPSDKKNLLMEMMENPPTEAAARIKEIEKQTSHDIKAVENYLREVFDEHGLTAYKEFIHFGLTSQDINNTAFPMALKASFQQVMLPALEDLIAALEGLARQWKAVAMLAHTHGQPASPTTVGKEIMVFVERLRKQSSHFSHIPFEGKFGGATGNLNAHYAAYPEIDWITVANRFLEEQLGLRRQQTTTQIEHYDNLAAFFDCLGRINTILLDACRDFWTYISMDYFTQKLVASEVGSSTMPHKVNPIDFENAEGNLGLANAVGHHLSAKLPVSRLQRDLTDSTVIRNCGVPLAHSLLAWHSMKKGLLKLQLNKTKISRDLQLNPAVITEAIQTILRREGIPGAYDRLKEISRGKDLSDPSVLESFIRSLDLPQTVKEELLRLKPETYTGKIPF
ncbi:MAG TPA: adenylosuccinate lyase [Bacteroidales bacterium]|nr:adenylosuccinate lyase [Bacteroidales bacterium]HSA43302.1 adenylosuccinate lyase [Bacteroidales bacterium]